MCGVGVAACDGRVDVAHDTVTAGHGGRRERLVEGFGELLLLFAILGASILEPHLKHIEGNDVSNVFVNRVLCSHVLYELFHEHIK